MPQARSLSRGSYRPNAGGITRTADEAVDLARRHGIEIDDDVRIGFIDDWRRLDADAEYAQLGGRFRLDDLIEWDDLLHDRTGMLPVRFNSALLQSDEALLAHIAHEMHEVNALRAIFAERGAITARELRSLIGSGVRGNLHDQAWDVADAMVRRLRGGHD